MGRATAVLNNLAVHQGRRMQQVRQAASPGASPAVPAGPIVTAGLALQGQQQDGMEWATAVMPLLMQTAEWEYGLN